jgi:hypothetical protein
MANMKALEGREKLKEIAKAVREYLKETGGTFGVRTQQNNVVWISGMYTFGVAHTVRQQCEARFDHWLKEMAEIWDVELHLGTIHRFIKEGEGFAVTDSAERVLLSDEDFVDQTLWACKDEEEYDF